MTIVTHINEDNHFIITCNCRQYCYYSLMLSTTIIEINEVAKRHDPKLQAVYEAIRREAECRGQTIEKILGDIKKKIDFRFKTQPEKRSRMRVIFPLFHIYCFCYLLSLLLY